MGKLSTKTKDLLTFSSSTRSSGASTEQWSQTARSFSREGGIINTPGMMGHSIPTLRHEPTNSWYSDACET